MGTVSAIKLNRTDTTHDLSQKAEKGMTSVNEPAEYVSHIPRAAKAMGALKRHVAYSVYKLPKAAAREFDQETQRTSIRCPDFIKNNCNVMNSGILDDSAAKMEVLASNQFRVETAVHGFE